MIELHRTSKYLKISIRTADSIVRGYSISDYQVIKVQI